MANFSIDSESNQKLLNESAKAAKEAGLNASRLAQSADASFAFLPGDKLTVPAQVASVIALTGEAKANAEKEGWATGFFSFDAYVTRKGRPLRCHVSAKQLFLPTVWLEAEAVNGETISDNSNEPLYSAPFREGVKRFGEQGSVTIVNKVPVIQSDIEVTLKSVDTAYTSVMSKKVPSGHAALRQRTDFVMAEE